MRYFANRPSWETTGYLDEVAEDHSQDITPVPMFFSDRFRWLLTSRDVNDRERSEVNELELEDETRIA